MIRNLQITFLWLPGLLVSLWVLPVEGTGGRSHWEEDRASFCFWLDGAAVVSVAHQNSSGDGKVPVSICRVRGCIFSAVPSSGGGGPFLAKLEHVMAWAQDILGRLGLKWTSIGGRDLWVSSLLSSFLSLQPSNFSLWLFLVYNIFLTSSHCISSVWNH